MPVDPKTVTGRARGGAVAAANMSEKARKDRSAKASIARWGLKATHKGNFKEEFGVDVECFVLNDPKKTAVISQRGMGAALELGDGGSKLPRLVSTKSLGPYVGPALREKLENPIVFQGAAGGPGTAPPPQVHGYDVTVLTELCRAIVQADADKKLQANQARLAKQANIILGASANAGIQGLVYALAGYRPEVEEVIQAFKMFVQEEAKKYEQEFPSELYLQWHRLYSIPVPARGKPWQMMHLTRRHVYYPLAKSSGKILDLLRALRDRDPGKKKLFQFLNDIGTRALRMHMGRVLEMAESSATQADYEARIVQRFGGQQELELIPRTE